MRVFLLKKENNSRSSQNNDFGRSTDRSDRSDRFRGAVHAPLNNIPLTPLRSLPPLQPLLRSISLSIAVKVVVLSLLLPSSVVTHTPYKQWVVYRKKHLVIGTCKSDPQSYPLGKRLAAALVAGLPQSKARLARALSHKRLASLFTTGQLQIIVLKADEAIHLRKGRALFKDFGPLEDLRLIFPISGYFLLSRKNFPERHAWLVSKTLSDRLGKNYGENGAQSNSTQSPKENRIALHPGVKAFLAGKPLPAAPPARESKDEEEEHSHHGPG